MKDLLDSSKQIDIEDLQHFRLRMLLELLDVEVMLFRAPDEIFASVGKIRTSGQDEDKLFNRLIEKISKQIAL